ncbi:MAG: UDP-N-acetylglucosamine 1-carboxyvinyltransferase [Planctomycetaceae bacterium]|jgi:UDP-N-acetylglucosamine 1-carboxyvinyltransferase|nr:UDP-N-acetylglucosamine 1-carboxyvinyltransferase [Phycisphaerales bacterium]MCE2653727.1 UDP-N-acetylglucosamine 1-carboxyvinyltransferase [Planctomycetaceae bacterium]
MDRFEIRGGNRLAGRLTIKGSKNAALPLMTGVLLTDQPFVLRDVPELADIANMRRLLAELGCSVEYTADNDVDSPGGVLTMRAVDETVSHARYEVVRTMRASISALGPMLARRGAARVSLPGGCAIGERPVDLHLRGLTALGADITLDSGDIVARIPRAGGRAGRLKGARVFMGGPFGSTVLGTANVMSAATLAEGTTIIECAACEPEIVDLANMLNAMGAKVEGAGSPRVTIHGVKELGPVDHRIIPDRIEAGTYMCAAAITCGDITLDNCPVDALMAHMDRLHHMGVTMQFDASSDPMRTTCRITAGRVLNPIEVTTQPHPGFPTDLQAQLMAVLCLADGNSVITERIFTERFLHVAELGRMGAQLYRQGSTVIVSGVRRLTGAPVMASDLRASACLVLAGLAAHGLTTVNRVYHLDRGYERMEDRLRALGADIQRTSEKEAQTGIASGMA